MLSKIPAILLMFFVLLAGCAGCTQTEITSPSGWSYRSSRLLTDTGLEEASIEPATGSVTVKGLRSDSSKALDVAVEALRRAPAVP